MDIFSFFSKLSGWYRLLLVASTIWIIIALIVNDPWTYGIVGRQGEGFLSFGILPVAVLWGLIWIFAVKMKGEKNNTAIQAKCRSCGDLADTAKGWTGPNCSFICQECIEIALCLLEEYRNKKN